MRREQADAAERRRGRPAEPAAGDDEAPAPKIARVARAEDIRSAMKVAEWRSEFKRDFAAMGMIGANARVIYVCRHVVVDLQPPQH